MTNGKPNAQTPQEEGLREALADLTALEEGIEELRRQREETAQGVYEFALDNAHGEQGHRRIEDFAREHRISYREAMVALADDVFPKAPEPIDEATSELVVMSEEEEREQFGLTNREIEAYASSNRLSYREAMIALSARPKEER